MKLKKILTCLIASLGITVATAQTANTEGETAAGPAKMQLLFQSAYGLKTNIYEMELAWANSIKSLTNNEIAIKLEPTGSVIPATDTLEAVQFGALDGSLNALYYNGSTDPAFAFLGDMVGAWTSPEELLGFIDSDAGTKLMQTLYNDKVTYLGVLTSSMESISANKKIASVEDFKDVKLRTPPGLISDVFKKIGAKPMSLMMNEARAALSSNLVDAIDFSTLSTNHQAGLHKLAQFPIYPGFHSLPLSEVIVNNDKWAKISPQSQQLITKSVKELRGSILAQLKKQDDVALKEITQDPNITIVSWTPEEVKKFRDIAKKEWENYAKKSDNSQLVYDAVTTYLKSK